MITYQKIQKFGQCTDAVAATNDECLSHGSQCIKDGPPLIHVKLWNVVMNKRVQMIHVSQFLLHQNHVLLMEQNAYQCSNYVEAGCFNGTDGECIFALPVATTTGNKTCRLNYCEVITGSTSNAKCMGIISEKSCVSNRTSCIAKTKLKYSKKRHFFSIFTTSYIRSTLRININLPQQNA